MIEHSESIKNISAALLEFQAETHGVVRDSQNPHFRNKYASLEAVIETAKPGLQKVGLTFIQAPSGFENGCVELTTMLIHPKSGEWMTSELPMPLSKQDPQGVGSAITYGLRYCLMAMLGLPPVDDDGEATRRSEGSYTKQLAGAGNQGPISAMADSTPISAEQFGELDGLVRKAKADLSKFLMVMNVNSLDDIPVSQFQRAKIMLEQKINLNNQIEDAKRKKQAGDNGRTARHVG